MEDFLAFAICFSFIVWIWVGHFHFFRRFALEDGWTNSLDAVLLFVVLFSVYPLNFLFTVLVRAMSGLGGGGLQAGGFEDGRLLPATAGPIRLTARDPGRKSARGGRWPGWPVRIARPCRG
jgi:hypothetical protein